MRSGGRAGTAAIALTQGTKGLDAVGLEVMRAVRPMLASTSPDASSAVTRLGLAAIDWKLDGARIQVHKQGDGVAVFTRNLNDVTSRLPEVVADVRGFDAWYLELHQLLDSVQ